MIELYIPYPKTNAQRKQWAKRYGMNAYYSGKHWAQRKADADFWHWQTRQALGNLRPVIYDKPVQITFFWNDRLDIDNHAVMGKMIVDALRGFLLQDDSRKYLKRVAHEFWDGDSIKIVIDGVK